MGLLGKIGKWAGDRWGDGPSAKGLKSSVKGTTHLVGKIADNKIVQGATAAALMATGVGAPAAAAIMGGMGAAGGGMKKGGNLRGALVGGATGAVSGYTAGAAGTAARAARAGIPSVGGAVAGQGAKMGLKDSIIGGIKNTVLGSDGKFGMADIGRGIKSVGGFINDNKGDLLDTAIGGLSAYEGYKANQQAGKLQQESLDMARGAYNDRAPLRDMGIARMTGAQRPDLSSIFGDSGNPYSRSGHIPSVGAAAPVAQPIPGSPPFTPTPGGVPATPQAAPSLPSVGGGIWSKAKRPPMQPEEAY